MTADDVVAWMERNGERTRADGHTDGDGWMWGRWAYLETHKCDTLPQAQAEAQPWADRDGKPASVYIDRHDGRSWQPWSLIYPTDQFASQTQRIKEDQ